MEALVYDFAQLVHTLDLAPVTIVAHSLGGNVATRYAGLYPDNVKKLVCIEGLGPSPDRRAKREASGIARRMRDWIEGRRSAAGRQIKRYPTIEAAYARMIEENSYLTADQARHLTEQGIARNEDGSWSWKFDNYLNIWPIIDIGPDQLSELWEAITCPTLLLYGKDSWATSPAEDGRLKHFRNAQLIEFENAGHWLHHDQFERFMGVLREFL
jgi:pimeloyl-ACP methyl ester carboxylesterase